MSDTRVTQIDSRFGVECHPAALLFLGETLEVEPQAYGPRVTVRSIHDCRDVLADHRTSTPWSQTLRQDGQQRRCPGGHRPG